MEGESYGQTIWTGGVFRNCVNEIVLYHYEFGANRTTTRGCYISNNFIVAQGLRVENGSHYISQLNVTVTSDMIGKSIECDYDNQINTTTTVGSINISKSGIIMHLYIYTRSELASLAPSLIL